MRPPHAGTRRQLSGPWSGVCRPPRGPRAGEIAAESPAPASIPSGCARPAASRGLAGRLPIPERLYLRRGWLRSLPQSAAVLVDELAGRGVAVLRGSSRPSAHLTDAVLLSELATHAQPRMRIAMIALLLARPELAAAVPTAVTLAAERGRQAADRLEFGYQAAVYLQRLWRTMIGLYVGRPPVTMPWLLDRFGPKWRLPSPEAGHGRVGLRALADLERRLHLPGRDMQGTYGQAVEMLRSAWLASGADAG